MISANNVTLRIGKKALFEDVNIKFVEGQCYGLIGANGAGKSTFLKILTGQLEPSKGDVSITPGQRLSFLEQDQGKYDDQPVLDTVIQGNQRLYEIMKEKEALYAKEDFTEEDGIKASELETEFADMDGWEAESDAATLLNGLGVDTELHYELMKDIPSALKVKVLLARALFGNPDILLLDEPTNHLDLNSVEWLEGYINAFKGTVLVISHDRYFIDRVAQRVIEIIDGHAEFYSGNYSFYMDEKQARFELQMKQYEQEQAKLKQLGYTVERMNGWGINNRTRYRRAMSIQHRMERIRKTERPKTEKTMKATFGEREFSGDVVFKLKNMSKSFGERTLFSDVELNVEGGERIALLGDNGTGKSTFLKCLLGEEDFSGKLQFGPTVKWGYLPQIIKFSHPERTLYDTMLYEKNCSPQVARDRLVALMFQGEDVFKTVGTLSGGEQSRLRLCMLMDEKINLLILDEPTNHLDIASREWIEAAIEEFEGVLLFVSHDRYFIEKFAERIWLLEDGKIRDFRCGYAKYRSIIEHEQTAKPAIAAMPKPKKEKPKGGNKEQDKLIRRLEREIEKQEKILAEYDPQIDAAAADYQELTRLLAEKEEAELVLMDLMEQWEAAHDG